MEDGRWKSIPSLLSPPSFILILLILLLPLTGRAQVFRNMAVDADALLKYPTNFFVANSNLLNAAVAAGSGGGSGDVATDAIWDAAGDLVVGTGANTAARLARGTALQVLRVNAGETALEWSGAAGGSLDDGSVTPAKLSTNALGFNTPLKGGLMVTPQMFAAGADIAAGVIDAQPSIQAGINYLSSAGGGTLYIPPGTYRLATVSGGNSILLEPKSSVRIQGAGEASVLKVANGLNGVGTEFHVFYKLASNPTALTNAAFVDFTIDFNGANNLVPSAGEQKNNVGIGVADGSDILVQNVRFLNNPGSQCLVFGDNTNPHAVSRVRIINCVFDTMANAVPGNTHNDDHSCIWTQVEGLTIEGCHFHNAAPDVETAIENHANNSTVTGNTIVGFNTGFNVVAENTDHINNVYSANTLRDVTRAFRIYASPSKTMSGLVISANSMESTQDVFPVIDLISNIATNSIFTDVLVEGNFIKTTATRSAEEGPGIAIGQITHAVIRGNTIEGAMGRGITTTFGVALVDNTRTVIIESNTLIDCGRTTDSNYQQQLGFLNLDTFKLLRVANNTILNTANGFATVALKGYGNGDRFEFLDNTVVNITTDFLWDDSTMLTNSLVRHNGSGGHPQLLTSIVAGPGSTWTDRDTGYTYEKKFGTDDAGWRLNMVGTNAPSSGQFYQGDIVRNENTPTLSSPSGWVCISTGTPGTWRPFGGVYTSSALTYLTTFAETKVVDTITASALLETQVSFGTVVNGGTAAMLNGFNHARVAFSGATATITLPSSPPSGSTIRLRVSNSSGGLQVITIPSLIHEVLQATVTTITNQIAEASEYMFKASNAGAWERVTSRIPTVAGGSGDVATDAIWDAAGDLVVGTGANTAARLARGTALQVLRVNAGETALEWSTLSGGGNAQTADTLDQFADVTQAGGATLAIDASTTLNGGTHSGTNTGDQTSVSGNAGTATALATGRTIAMTGDVTWNSGSFDGTGNVTAAGTIANSAVTLAKMANLAQDQFIGRTTASTGVPETATITAAARTVLDDPTVAEMVDTLGGASATGSGGLARATSPTFVTPVLGAATATSVEVNTEAYDDAGWNGDNTVPTKDALRDKFESQFTYVRLQPASLRLSSTVPPGVSSTVSTGTGAPTRNNLEFDAAANESAFYTFVVPDNLRSGDWSITYVWSSASTTSGDTIIWGNAFSATSEGDADDLEEDAESTANTASEDVNTTEARRMISTTVTCSNLDSVAAGDLLTIRFYRDAVTDDGAGDARLSGLLIKIPVQ